MLWNDESVYRFSRIRIKDEYCQVPSFVYLRTSWYLRNWLIVQYSYMTSIIFADFNISQYVFFNRTHLSQLFLEQYIIKKLSFSKNILSFCIFLLKTCHFLYAVRIVFSIELIKESFVAQLRQMKLISDQHLRAFLPPEPFSPISLPLLNTPP